jgi:hypothetical protein
MSIATKFRRLVNLYKLLWAGDRLDELETHLNLVRGELDLVRGELDLGRRELDAANARVGAATAELQSQIDQVRGDSGRLGETMYQMAAQTGSQLKILGGDLDALKSSLEVPQEMVDDFFAWKSCNPIPAHPLVSVTVVTYNRARLLTERCIPSILTQTYDNLELIIVGDCCTDETEELVSRIKDPRLKFYNLPERGPYPADPIRRWMVAGTAPANKARSLAQGDFITHLDDDDEYVPDRLAKLVKFAIDNQCDFVWHPFWWEQNDGNWIINQAVEIAHGEITNGAVLYRGWFKNVQGNMDAYRLMEPGDWNRFRRIKYIGPVAMRYPEPLLRHYRERNQPDTSLTEFTSKL